MPVTNYLNVPVSFTASPNAFASILTEARTRPIRICMIGDSQESQTYGNGDPFCSALNHYFACRYGNAPMSTLASDGNFGYNGATNAFQGSKWLMTARTPYTVVANLMPSTKLPPSYGTYSFDVQDNYTGCKPYILNHNNISCLDQELRLSSFFDSSMGTYFESFWHRRPDSKPMKLKYGTYTTHSHGNFLSGGVANVGYQRNILPTGIVGQADGTIIKHTSNLIPAHPAGTYLNVGFSLEVASSGVNENLEGRFITGNPAKQFGVVVDNFGAGGATVDSWLSTYSNAAETMKAMGPWDIVFINLAANDNADANSQVYQDNMTALISWVRTRLADSNVPIVLSTDGYRTHASTPIETVYQEIPGRAYELANDLRNVMACNMQRLCTQLGYTSANEAPAGLTDRGTWAASTAYSVNDKVQIRSNLWSYINDIYEYVCIEAHTSDVTTVSIDSTNNKLPPNDRYWKPLNRYTADGVHLKTRQGANLANHFVNSIFHSAFIPTKFDHKYRLF